MLLAFLNQSCQSWTEWCAGDWGSAMATETLYVIIEITPATESIYTNAPMHREFVYIFHGCNECLFL